MSTLEEKAAGKVEQDVSALRRRLIVLIPLVAFLALAALFMFRLGSGDPSRIPSALIQRTMESWFCFTRSRSMM